LKTKVVQGSVLTHLRCDGIFSDQFNEFITQSLLSPRAKFFWGKIGQHLRSYGQLSTGSFFMKHSIHPKNDSTTYCITLWSITRFQLWKQFL